MSRKCLGQRRLGRDLEVEVGADGGQVCALPLREEQHAAGLERVREERDCAVRRLLWGSVEHVEEEGGVERCGGERDRVEGRLCEEREWDAQLRGGLSDGALLDDEV